MAGLEGEESGEWVVDPFNAPHGLNWGAEGDEWLHHLMQALGEVVPISGHSRTLRLPNGHPYPPHYEIRATSNDLTSSLRVVLLKDGLYLFITGSGEPGAGQIDPWLAAIRAADERLGKALEAFQWKAGEAMVRRAPA